jgi:DNA-binding transcriptional ArsR family regulator
MTDLDELRDSRTELLLALSAPQRDAVLDQLSEEQMAALIASLDAEEDSQMETILAKLDELVQGSHFREVTSEFFQKYCFEFSDDEENRLEYTAIHKEYEALVESLLETLGDDYLYVCEHFADFMANPGELTETRLSTLETLTAATNFELFKAGMLAAQAEVRLGVLAAHLDALGTPPEDVAALVES